MSTVTASSERDEEEPIEEAHHLILLAAVRPKFKIGATENSNFFPSSYSL